MDFIFLSLRLLQFVVKYGMDGKGEEWRGLERIGRERQGWFEIIYIIKFFL